jgi:hypothetical protein
MLLRARFWLQGDVACMLATQPESPASHDADPVARPHKRVLGNMRRCCGGRCIVPTDACHAITLGALIVFPVGVFCTSVVTDAASIVAALVLAAPTIAALVCAVTFDPGILPPASSPGEWCDDGERRDDVVGGVAVTVTACRTCHIMRPPRSGHCSVCDTCVEEYDHHCGVLGSCVGRRTFRFFAGFMQLVTALGLYLCARSVAAAAAIAYLDAAQQSHLSRWRVVATVGCIIYTGFGVLCVSWFAGLYTYLACCGLTQKDQHHRVNYDVVRAQRRSCPCFECACRLCGPLPPSRV